jgi:hypothetical protein
LFVVGCCFCFGLFGCPCDFYSKAGRLFRLSRCGWCFVRVGGGRVRAMRAHGPWGLRFLFPYALDFLQQLATRYWWYALTCLQQLPTRSWCYGLNFRLELPTRSWRICFQFSLETSNTLLMRRFQLQLSRLFAWSVACAVWTKWDELRPPNGT